LVPLLALLFAVEAPAQPKDPAGEAKKQFEAALALKPDMAEAHYWVGMAHLNEGKMQDAVEHFEEYLKLAPNGQYVEQAKGVLSQIKK
jgi:lipoprotein NlpI